MPPAGLTEPSSAWQPGDSWAPSLCSYILQHSFVCTSSGKQTLSEHTAVRTSSGGCFCSPDLQSNVKADRGTTTLSAICRCL